MDIFRATKYEMSEEFKKDLKVFMGGMKREVVRQHVQRRKVLDEGKKPMSYEIYRHLCQALSKSGDAEDVFCHLFLVLEWNLMARSENCLQMSLTHIQWRNDSLIFFWGKSKRNQEGDANHHPWHVYSNPFEPALCPVLALGKYLLTFTNVILGEKCPVFPSTNQYKRFNELLSKLLIREGENLRSLGADLRSIGTYSIRKGAISLVSAGCTVSPPNGSNLFESCMEYGERERSLYSL